MHTLVDELSERFRYLLCAIVHGEKDIVFTHALDTHITPWGKKLQIHFSAIFFYTISTERVIGLLEVFDN